MEETSESIFKVGPTFEGTYDGDVTNQDLGDLTTNFQDTYAKYAEKAEAAAVAEEEFKSANSSYLKAAQDYGDDLDSYGSTNSKYKDAFDTANAARQEAQSKLDSATEALEAATNEVATAEAAMYKKKDEIEEARPTDLSYCTLHATISCSCGLHTSLLLLPRTRGIFVKNQPQVFIHDNVLNTNILNFGSCISDTNPNKKAAAKLAVDDAKTASEEIEKKEFLKSVNDFFCSSDAELKIDPSLLNIVLGECIPTFPAGAKWSGGKETVTTNGFTPLLRRSEMRCDYGGTIIIEANGQPD